MGLFGWLTGGASGFGPSKMYDAMPYKGWREQSTWVEELIDACGYRFDVLNSRFISAAARAKLLDPTVTPTDSATQYFANATTPATSSTSTDTMLDVALFIALGLYPADSNLTVAQKQALVQVGWDFLKRKGTRLRLENLTSKISDGIVYGWTVPPNNFSLILPDGAPDPGYGNWVQSNGTTAEVIRPWILSALRSTLSGGTVAFGNLGVGYSQFRAGYSSAGETVFPSGCRINILSNEHFSSWFGGVPVGWSQTGTGGTLTQSTSASSINWEYTGSAAVLDLTAVARGTSIGLLQAAGNINNQLTHRFQVDYAYTNSQNVSVLTAQITDANRDGKTYYWNPTTATWSTTAYSIPIPPSSSRARFACDVVPQTTALTGTTFGTSAINVLLTVKSDGTATTQTTFTLYRAGLYEKFNLALEQVATGERTLWLPLIDGPGWSTASRGAGGSLLEIASADRSSYRIVTSAVAASFPYHPALSAHGFRAHGAWTNLVKGSNDFGADWTLTNATRTANAAISPIVGETVASVPTLTATNTAAKIVQGSLGTPTSKTYVGGVWVKKLSTDGNFTDVTVSLISTSTKSTAFTLKQSQGWQLLPFVATFGGGDVAALQLQIAWGAASNNGQIAVADAYLYDVTSNPAVLYPPVVRSGIGATGTLAATACQALTANQNVNVLHPLTQRTLVSVVKGTLGLTVVPTYDATSQPNGVIFDCAQGAAQNRVVVRINSGALELRRWDNAGNQWVATLTLTKSVSPTSSQVSWLRDTAITVRCFWDANTTMLSAGSSNASGTKPGSWAPSDISVAAVGVGNDWQSVSANQFEGTVTLSEVDQLGTPTS
jgi:hypothetical protein